MSDIKITDNSSETEAEMDKKVKAILEAWGLTAEGHAKDECPVDTGRLRNSISWAVKDDSVYIGTNVEYAKVVEFRDSATHTVGNAHFLRNAAANHSEEYKTIAEKISKT